MQRAISNPGKNKPSLFKFQFLSTEEKQMVQEQPVAVIKSQEKTSRLPLILGLIGLILILGMSAMLSFYHFHYDRLNGEVRLENHHFLLSNDSDYEWTDIRIWINTDYRLNMPSLAPHTVLSATLPEFKLDDGTKLKDSDFLIDVYITAVTPEKNTVTNIFKLDQYCP
jgi:hypothetical protein